MSSISGLTLCVAGVERALGIGTRCLVHGASHSVWGEVIASGDGIVQLLPFGTWHGIAVGDSVEIGDLNSTIRPDVSWVGSVVDAFGRKISGQGANRLGPQPADLRRDPPPAFQRRQVGAKLETKIKCVDIFTPFCQGQRMGLFAGSGVGKSTLMGMFARNSVADINVIALIGERGREVQDFLNDVLGPEGLAKSIVVVATGDESPLMRRQAAWTATAIAEYFRDSGQHVLLLMDSLTRFAMAQREIGLSRHEPPTTKGYPPTVFSELPHLVERAGPGRAGEGDITALYTVLVDGDDMNEPISDAVRGIVDGHIVLDRSIAENGRFPAVDIQRSLSRMLPGCHAFEELQIMKYAKQAFGNYTNMEDLIKVGAYKEGTHPDTDAAIRFFKRADEFLTQTQGDVSTSDQSFVEIYKLLLEAGIDVPLQADA